MKYISIDIETCGLDPRTCDMIEFGAIIDDFDNPLPYEKCPKIRVLFDQDIYRGQAGALAMHGGLFQTIRDKDVSGHTFLNQVHIIKPGGFGNLFKEWVESAGIEGTPTAAGKNLGAFDMRWLEEHIRVRHRILDVGSMFFNPRRDKALPNLQTCLQRCGIDKTIDHTSVADAWDVVQCIRYYYTNKETQR